VRDLPDGLDSPTTSPLLTLDHLSFGYEPGSLVLNDISVEVDAGSVVGVVGPSGCGKSTLLSIVAGLLPPSSGSVRWAPPAGDSGRHPLSMMFQTDTLLPWLTVEQNVGLHFRLTKHVQSKSERSERVANLIALAGLTGSEDKYPYQLSGGMRRRTAFLAAVAPRPRTLLLDEPFSSLDEPTRIAIHQDIHQVIKRDKISTLLITHDLAEAISLSDEVIVLTARPTQVYERFHIPFGTERDMLALRKDPLFLSIYGQLWEKLAIQIQNSRKAST
jgi:NitT/TauT family transport system ATP-binding protein